MIDNLDACVDTQVYFKAQDDEAGVKSSQCQVNNRQSQIASLARTLSKQTMSSGMAIARTEQKDIDPPQNVQATINKAVRAESENVAALDLANAVERQADG